MFSFSISVILAVLGRLFIHLLPLLEIMYIRINYSLGQRGHMAFELPSCSIVCEIRP